MQTSSNFLISAKCDLFLGSQATFGIQIIFKRKDHPDRFRNRSGKARIRRFGITVQTRFGEMVSDDFGLDKRVVPTHFFKC